MSDPQSITVARDSGTECAHAGSLDGIVRLHVYAPRPTERKGFRVHCPTCNRRTYMLGWFYEWYGWTVTCLHCGEMWTGEEMHNRPFARGWRKHNIEAAKKHWRQVPPNDPSSAATGEQRKELP